MPYIYICTKQKTNLPYYQINPFVIGIFITQPCKYFIQYKYTLIYILGSFVVKSVSLMKRPLLYICISLISILILFSGCEDYGQEILSPFLDPNEIFLKDTCDVDVVLFQQQILPIIVRECASSGCHDSDSEAAGVKLDNYQSIIQLISTDDTTQSRLWNVLSQNTDSIHQPTLKLKSVTTLELQQISNWISQGGLNTNCESYCEFTEVDLSDIEWENNGTSDVETDDYYTFSINVKGANLSSAYILKLGILDTVGVYNKPLSLRLKKTLNESSSIILTLTDTEKKQCVYSKRIRLPDLETPVEEEDDCVITEAGLSEIQCNDNNTPQDPLDDFISFILNPNGTGLSEGYTLTGTGIDASGIYGESTSFTAPAGSSGQGDMTITLMDNDSASCVAEFIVNDPGNCAETPACELQQAGLANVQCHDNNTPNNPEDDFIIFTLNPMGNQINNSYTVSGEGIEATGKYGQAEPFNTAPGSAGDGDVTLTITDQDATLCSLEITLPDPGFCTPDCNVLQSGLSDVNCHDNDTPDDPQDDYITFTLNPSGVGTSTNYLLTAKGLDETGIYGQNKTFATPRGTAGQGNIVLTMTDSASSDCSLEIILEDPGVCTPPCDITQAGLSNIECNNNDTSENPSDDYFTFTINASAGASTGNYSISGGGVNATGTYGQAVNVESPLGSAGKGDITITITDANNPACTASLLLVDRGTCSE